MSFDMWHRNGCGINIAAAPPKKYRMFILAHAQKKDDAVVKETLKYCLENETIDYEDLRDMSFLYTIAEPVAASIQSETGIALDCPGLDNNGLEYVLFEPGMPWQYNSIEKNIKNKEVLEKIFKPYADELGVSVDMDVDLVYSSS